MEKSIACDEKIEIKQKNPWSAQMASDDNFSKRLNQ